MMNRLAGPLLILVCIGAVLKFVSIEFFPAARSQTPSTATKVGAFPEELAKPPQIPGVNVQGNQEVMDKANAIMQQKQMNIPMSSAAKEADAVLNQSQIRGDQGVPGDPSFPVPISNPEGFIYDPSGRRDPFKPTADAKAAEAPKEQKAEAPKRRGGLFDTPQTDSLQGYDIDQFQLTGIIWDVRDPKALVLTPKGTTFFVKRRTKIGRNEGYVATIREGEVVVVELAEDGQNYVPRVLSLGGKPKSSKDGGGGT